MFWANAEDQDEEGRQVIGTVRLLPGLPNRKTPNELNSHTRSSTHLCTCRVCMHRLNSAEVKAEGFSLYCHKPIIARVSLTVLITVSRYSCDGSLGQHFIFLRALADERFPCFSIFCSDLSKIIPITFFFPCVILICVDVTSQEQGPTLSW